MSKWLNSNVLLSILLTSHFFQMNVNLPDFTWSPICISDIVTDFLFFRETLAEAGKQSQQRWSWFHVFIHWQYFGCEQPTCLHAASDGYWIKIKNLWHW